MRRAQKSVVASARHVSVAASAPWRAGTRARGAARRAACHVSHLRHGTLLRRPLRLALLRRLLLCVQAHGDAAHLSDEPLRAAEERCASARGHNGHACQQQRARGRSGEGGAAAKQGTGTQPRQGVQEQDVLRAAAHRRGRRAAVAVAVAVAVTVTRSVRLDSRRRTGCEKVLHCWLAWWFAGGCGSCGRHAFPVRCGALNAAAPGTHAAGQGKRAGFTRSHTPARRQRRRRQRCRSA